MSVQVCRMVTCVCGCFYVCAQESDFVCVSMMILCVSVCVVDPYLYICRTENREDSADKMARPVQQKAAVSLVSSVNTGKCLGEWCPQVARTLTCLAQFLVKPGVFFYMLYQLTLMKHNTI